LSGTCARSFDSMDLNKFDTGELRFLQTEINRALAKRLPKTPVSILNEWKTRSQTREVVYVMQPLGGKSKRGYLGTIKIVIDSKRFFILSNGVLYDVLVGVEETQRNAMKAKRNLKRLLAQEALDVLGEA